MGCDPPYFCLVYFYAGVTGGLTMIKIANLVKKFGDKAAVDKLNLQIFAGEAFGLLGPNGAGKTTLIRILTMLAKATAGEITIAGHDVQAEPLAIKQIIGIVPQHFNLDSDLTCAENLVLHAKLHHIPESQYRQSIKELLEFVELYDRRFDRVDKFSGGMKRRLMIARALLHQPKILFLDEPTVGLDPQVRRNLWGIIRKMKNQGMTVLLTTHYIEEAEALCDRVAIMEKGKLMVTDTPQALKAKLGQFVVEYLQDEVLQTKFFASREQAAEFAAIKQGMTLIRDCNLEDVFVELTGRKVL